VIDVQSHISHRPPFLFVDDAYIENETIYAEHTFDSDEWFFKGHFPRYPIVPGVILVESMAQAGGVGASLMGICTRGLVMLAKIKEVRFKQPVRPGDTFKMEIKNIRASSVYLQQKGIGKVGDTVVVEGEWIGIASGVPMIVKPMVRNNVCLNAHPEGCKVEVRLQADRAKAFHERLKSSGKNGASKKPLHALIIGCSTGYGLASRLVAAFGYEASTIGFSYEREPTATKPATPGWYANKEFDRLAAEKIFFLRHSQISYAFSHAAK